MNMYMKEQLASGATTESICKNLTVTCQLLKKLDSGSAATEYHMVSQSSNRYH
jgi:hypothetical protein